MSDFGEGHWVIGRKAHRCEGCFGPIPRGEKHFLYKGMYQCEWQNWRMHEECHEDWHTNLDLHGDGEFTPGYMPVPQRIRTLMKESAA